jgi:membrane protease YdiL (CAAX protease family)
MRVPVSLAWVILAMTFFTAGLLRQFHHRTPVSPMASPIVGSLLFASIFVLLLVTAREWRRGAVSGPGLRLGSLTPIMLMLLIEKWFSISVYPRVFWWFAPVGESAELLDAQYRAFAGLGLIVVCLLVGTLSTPARRKTWRRARPSRWPRAALAGVMTIGGCYLLLAAISATLGGGLSLRLPQGSPTFAWVLGGQAVLAFAEELYFRGLLMSELHRLAPRLGIRSAPGRRWFALLSTAGLFTMEHMTVGPPWGSAAREMIFTLSLGVLFGLLIMVSANLHFAAVVHTWINWLLLGAAPYFVDAMGRAALPAGTYIGVTLILAFVLAFLFQRGGPQPARQEADALVG